LEKWLIDLNWIIVNGLAVMLVDGLIDYDQDNFVRIIKRQLESLFDR
ncbi:TetR/AcrR family transcriptional regulator, partial [Streptococcus thermophilus]|nr:TetR/AcrR family transcriptional regulator [Streptococcus thermophilus]